MHHPVPPDLRRDTQCGGAALETGPVLPVANQRDHDVSPKCGYRIDQNVGTLLVRESTKPHDAFRVGGKPEFGTRGGAIARRRRRTPRVDDHPQAISWNSPRFEERREGPRHGHDAGKAAECTHLQRFVQSVAPITSMLEWGSQKLTELRDRMPEAGGLVIAPSIEMAEYMVKVLEQLDGEQPFLVHSQMSNPESKIRAFRNTTKRWLVSVAMVSEGVDIRRLRVLVYLPNALTELAFRQAIGRVVRTCGPDDDTRAYVVMPSFETFEAYARRVEEEMSFHPAPIPTSAKALPGLPARMFTRDAECPECGYEFATRTERVKNCTECGALNPIAASRCHACGASFEHSFALTLDEALRTGAIVRGMDIEESEVQAAEQMAPAVRKLVLQSGDQRLVRILQTLPDESWARLKNILAANG